PAAPRPRAAAPPRAAAAPPRAAAAPSAAPAVSSQFDAKGFLRDPTTWTMELADAVANTEGIPLTEAHWVVIRSARSEWEATGSSPNVRKLTQVADIPTRDLYTLFPRAPGLTIARLAGIPKPAGCL
ncbi:MAG: TusE/DsrC/DsvC family sulfur relay protein, partial [Myxococcota bacterium]